MKIAHIDVNYQYSSTGKLVADLVAGLAQRGHSTVACFGRGADPGLERVYKISSSAEVIVHALGTRLTGLTGGFSPLATRRLLRLLVDFAPDVVHLHDLHGYFLNIGELVEYLKSTNTSTVWTFHCEFMYTGKCGYALDCEKWKSHCDKCPQLRAYPESWLFDFTARMFEEKRRLFAGFSRLHLTAPSAWLADRMRESVIVGGKRITVVPNGLDLSVFHPRKVQALRAQLGVTNDYIALSVGSNLMSEIKGGRWVLQLARRRPEITFVMVGVDETPPSMPDNVKLVPRVYDQIILAQYYSMADVLLLTSEKETFSMVCAESLACGTPVIGFDSGAPKEVAPRGFGAFVPYGDLDALELLICSAQQGLLALNAAQDCTAFAASRYGTDVMVKAYEEIYLQLLNQG